MRLVGRDTELRALEAALSAATAGERRTLGLLGEAGIGKSALLDALAHDAERRGLIVLAGAAAEHERDVPFSRMLLGGHGPDGSDPGFQTQGGIFFEVRSVGQKSGGMLEQLFLRPTMAVLNAAADGSLYQHPGTGWDDIPFGQSGPCGGGPDL